MLSGSRSEVIVLFCAVNRRAKKSGYVSCVGHTFIEHVEQCSYRYAHIWDHCIHCYGCWLCWYRIVRGQWKQAENLCCHHVHSMLWCCVTLLLLSPLSPLSGSISLFSLSLPASCAWCESEGGRSVSRLPSYLLKWQLLERSLEGMCDTTRTHKLLWRTPDVLFFCTNDVRLLLVWHRTDTHTSQFFCFRFLTMTSKATTTLWKLMDSKNSAAMHTKISMHDQ